MVAGQAFLDAGKGDSRAAQIPGDLTDTVEEMRGALSEAAAESNDALLEKYLEQGSLAPEEIQSGLRVGVHRGTTFPVLPVSAETQVGLDRLLEFITAWGPSPLDAPPPMVLREGQSEPVRYESRNDGPPVVFVFKTYFDERLGEYTCLRCYSGKFTPGDYYNPRKQTSVRAGALYALRGKERVDIEALPYGDIGATSRIRGTDTNDTLGSKDSRVLIQPIAFTNPLHTVAVSAPNRADMEKVAGGFNRLAEFDPTLRVTVDSALKQTLLSGLGDQHIDVQVERLRARSKVEAETKKQRIAYRETIQGTIEDIQGRYKKQTGGRGQYGDVHLKLEPLPRGGGFEFVDAIVGGVVPSRGKGHS